MNQHKTIWTAELDARLRAEWESGKSTSLIADAMKLTKGTVIGRAHRLKLPSRPHPIYERPNIRVPVPPTAMQRELVASMWNVHTITEIIRVTKLRHERIQALARDLGLPPQLVSKSRAVVARPAARAPKEFPSRAASPSRPSAGDPRSAVTSEHDVSSQNSPGADLTLRQVFSGRKCQYPLWADVADHRYCDAPVIARHNGCASPYCLQHFARVYEPMREKTERNAA
ncbi:MAG: hypothetical protein ING08_08105 [Roseomonas sp.]|nr:hypothetical protein [Roseomonas sp.]